MGTEQFTLHWNDYQRHLATAFEDLLTSREFVDVTLGCEGKKLSAHKMLLSSCSPFFRELLHGNTCQHPIIVLSDIKYKDLESIIQFVYNGKVNILQDELNSFLRAAEILKIQGLTENNVNNSQTYSEFPPSPKRPRYSGQKCDREPNLEITPQVVISQSKQTFIKEEVDQEEQDCFYEDTTTLEAPVTNEAENIFVGYDMTDTTQNEDNSNLVNGSEHDNVTTLISGTE